MSTICSTVGRTSPGRKSWRPPQPDKPQAPGAGMSTICWLSRMDDNCVRWHFHQLFRHLRLTESRARRAGWQRHLGHCDNLLRNRRIVGLQHGHQMVHHLRHRNAYPAFEPWERSRQAAPRCAAKSAPVAPAADPDRVAVAGRWVLPDCGRVVRLVLATLRRSCRRTCLSRRLRHLRTALALLTSS